MSSYSTSLNILFFYLTWSTLVLSHPPLRVELVGTLAVRVIFFLVPSTVMFAFDALIPSAAAAMKAQGGAGLPIAMAKRKGEKRAVFKTVGWSLLNLLMSVAMQGIVEFVLTRIVGVRSALRVTTTLPMPWGIMTDLMWGLAGREIIHYLLHRYLLHDSASPYLSRKHQTWFLSIAAPYPFTAHYDHPLAYLLTHFVPTYLPAVLCRYHLLTYLIYLAFISIEETFAYSGYSVVPTNFVLGGVARRIDRHVLSEGDGNFGPWGVLDWVLGTSAGGETIADDLRNEAERKDLDGRVEKMIEGARRRGKEAVEGNGNGVLAKKPRTSRRKNGAA